MRAPCAPASYHGVAHLPWIAKPRFKAEWRTRIQECGFGEQNKLVTAQTRHAGYCARYISTRLAKLEPMKRAYSFSRGFPKQPTATPDEMRDVLVRRFSRSSSSAAPTTRRSSRCSASFFSRGRRSYAAMWDLGPRGVEGFEWFFVVLAFVVDLTSIAGGSRARRSED